MSGTVDTLTAARNSEAADLPGTFKDIHTKLDVTIRMSVANLAVTSVILGIALAMLL